MKGKKISTLNLLLIIQLVVMIALSLIITKTISSATRKNTMEHMQTVADERAHIIETYVKNAEKVLTYYSKAEQISKLLRNPTNPTIVSNAQKYTENFSNDIDNLEGIYASEWNTHVLTHTNPGTVGMTTRTEAGPLKDLQEAMLAAGDGVYNTGMIISPATGKQIVSMYKAVYNDAGEPIGLVGLGIYTDRLIDNLNSLKIKGIDDSFYSMVNVNDGKYVFNNDEELVTKTAENDEIQKLCEDLKGTKKSGGGSFEYEKDGVKYISTYSYIPKYGWILMLDDTKAEVYSLARIMRVYMAIFGLAVISLMILFSFINKKQERVNQKLASTIIKSNKTKESLYTAMFKDVLTEVSNRIAFSMDLEEVQSDRDNPYYFAMFNICNFSEINSRYGNDTGDWLLVRTVDILRQIFKDKKIYRTGSDEFVVALQVENATTGAADVMSDVSDAVRRLSATQNTPVGKNSFKYKSSLVKKSGQINSSVITVLKDLTNQSDPSGNIGFADMDVD